MSDKTYIDNGYTFTVYDNGTKSAEGKVPTEGVNCKGRVTPDGMQTGDQRGHLIAAQEGGPNKGYNMTAQNGNLNQGQYKTVETAEATLAKQGYDVNVSKTAFVSNQEGRRPDAYMINDTITSPDGKTQSVNLSFQNESRATQEAQNQLLENEVDIDDSLSINPLRDSMNATEYSALMEETNSSLPSLKDSFDMQNATEISYEQASESQTAADSSPTVSESSGCDSGSGLDAGFSSGVDGGADGGCSAGCGIGM